MRRIAVIAVLVANALSVVPVVRADFIYQSLPLTYYSYSALNLFYPVTASGAGASGRPGVCPPPGPGGTGADGGSCLRSNIAPRGELLDGGQRVVVAGPVRCLRGEKVSMRLTVVQRRTHTVAQLGMRGPCPGKLRAYKVTVPVRVGGFVAGRAFACLLGATERGGRYLDVNQWCRWINLTAHL